MTKNNMRRAAAVPRDNSLDTMAREPAVGRGQGDALIAYLDSSIASGDWVAGVKLPSERELALRFAVSRGTVRKVVDDFVSRGVLRRAAGSGTYVVKVPPGDAQASASVTEVSPAELMEARLLFEPLLPGLIVRHATPQDFARLQECLERAEAATSIAEFELWDGALHQALSQATHNAFMIAVLQLMTAVREAGEWGRLKQQALTPARRARYETQHRDIVAALRERNARAASRLIETHLVEVRANLFEA